MSGYAQVYTSHSCAPGVGVYKASEMYRYISGVKKRYAGASTFDQFAYSPFMSTGSYYAGGSYFGNYWHVI